nr:MAG: hypothetical protein DIU56_00750 [Pseudomonadota bacterium]
MLLTVCDTRLGIVHATPFTRTRTVPHLARNAKSVTRRPASRRARRFVRPARRTGTVSALVPSRPSMRPPGAGTGVRLDRQQIRGARKTRETSRQAAR